MMWGGDVHVPTGHQQVDGTTSSLITYIHHQLVMFMPCCGTLAGVAMWCSLPTHWLAAVFTHPLLGIMSVCRSLASVVAWWCGWSLLPVVPALWVPPYPRSCWPWLVLTTATPLPVEPPPPLATLVSTDYICHACILILFDCCIMLADAQVWFLGDLRDPDRYLCCFQSSWVVKRGIPLSDWWPVLPSLYRWHYLAMEHHGFPLKGATQLGQKSNTPVKPAFLICWCSAPWTQQKYWSLTAIVRLAPLISSIMSGVSKCVYISIPHHIVPSLWHISWVLVVCGVSLVVVGFFFLGVGGGGGSEDKTKYSAASHIHTQSLKTFFKFSGWPCFPEFCWFFISAKATYAAISKTYSYLTPDLWKETVFTKSPYQEFTDYLMKNHSRVAVQRQEQKIY